MLTLVDLSCERPSPRLEDLPPRRGFAAARSTALPEVNIFWPADCSSICRTQDYNGPAGRRRSLQCLYCGKESWLPSGISRDPDFCSLAHREKYNNRFNLAMRRIGEVP